MFLVKDASNDREERLKHLSTEDASLAELLGIIHVEWTIRRAVIALGISPNVELRKALEACHGLPKYKEVWKKEIVQGGLTRTNPVIHQPLCLVIKNWEGLIKAFKLRHKLVHGAASCSAEYAIKKLDWAIDAARDVRAYCLNYEIDIDKRLPVRRQVASKQVNLVVDTVESI